ncbi:3-hydroxyisobutyryl-CoA hydrolase [Thalictrum thalictroides]|uniref:3-hydroxyisobutyryl-CoA hydrolase n=1 Tax=Thalictrum thalictroides TaxID=46969 RepID=A0A7J6X916_THATH|nr:3-hydroxyisobutyryl-CoA hydrolase [Thalictrum thalictroides]
MTNTSTEFKLLPKSYTLSCISETVKGHQDGGNKPKIREGRLQGVGQCLVREYRMVCHVLRRKVSKDFFEGCRAILLDKDKNPKWEPSRLELINNEMVDHYFSKVDDEDWEDLKLPDRPNLPAYAVAKL